MEKSTFRSEIELEEKFAIIVGSQRTVWEIPKSANETGLVGLIDDGKILVISVDPDSANIPRHSETASMASRDVLKLLDGQYTCRDIWSGQSATVTLVSPCKKQLKFYLLFWNNAHACRSRGC